MVVTDIVELSKTRAKVCTDSGETFALYKGELKEYQIQKGRELSKETYRTVMEEVLPKRAKLRCMNLLKSRDYTEHQLRDKLKQGIYPEEVIDKALAYVENFGYVDDIRYAKAYIIGGSGTKSRRQIEEGLLRRGISKEDMRQAWARCSEDGDVLSGEEEAIERLLARKRFDVQEAGYEERMKMIGFLYRKGFSLDKIYKAVGHAE